MVVLPTMEVENIADEPVVASEELRIQERELRLK